MGCGKSKDKKDDQGDPPGGGAAVSTRASGSRAGSIISRLSESGAKYVVIKFFHADEPDIARVHEEFSRIADQNPEMIFMEADARTNEDAIKELKIEDYPAFVAFRKHAEISRYEGKDMGEVRKMVDLLKNHVVED